MKIAWSLGASIRPSRERLHASPEAVVAGIDSQRKNNKDRCGGRDVLVPEGEFSRPPIRDLLPCPGGHRVPKAVSPDRRKAGGWSFWTLLATGKLS